MSGIRLPAVSAGIASLREPVFDPLVQCVGDGTEPAAVPGRDVVACYRRFDHLPFLDGPSLRRYLRLQQAGPVGFYYFDGSVEAGLATADRL